MLTAVLPGLRDLRTPLAAGYIWVACLWFGGRIIELNIDLDHEPTTEPFHSVWSVGQSLGPAVCLGIVSFFAYLIGSFLEITPESWVARLAAVEVGARRKVREFGTSNPSQSTEALRLSASDRWLRSALSDRTEHSLATYIAQRTQEEGREAPTDAQRTDVMTHLFREEEGQLSTTLLVKNRELFDRYDRLRSEAYLRLNIAIPLAALASFVSSGNLRSYRAVAALVTVLVLCLLLMRQGHVRAVAARGVLVQALSIKEIGLAPDLRLNDGPQHGTWDTFGASGELSRRTRLYRFARRAILAWDRSAELGIFVPGVTLLYLIAAIDAAPFVILPASRHLLLAGLIRAGICVGFMVLLWCAREGLVRSTFWVERTAVLSSIPTQEAGTVQQKPATN